MAQISLVAIIFLAHIKKENTNWLDFSKIRFQKKPFLLENDEFVSEKRLEIGNDVFHGQ